MLLVKSHLSKIDVAGVVHVIQSRKSREGLEWIYRLEIAVKSVVEVLEV